MSAGVSAVQHGQQLSTLWPGFHDLRLWGVVLALAASGAASAALQSRGQTRISASRAQVRLLPAGKRAMVRVLDNVWGDAVTCQRSGDSTPSVDESRDRDVHVMQMNTNNHRFSGSWGAVCRFCLRSHQSGALCWRWWCCKSPCRIRWSTSEGPSFLRPLCWPPVKSPDPYEIWPEVRESGDRAAAIAVGVYFE